MTMGDKKKIQAILIDLDGTLRDTGAAISSALQHAIQTHTGQQVSHDDLKPHIHHHSVVHKAFAADVDYGDFRASYTKVLDPKVESSGLFPNTLEVLDALKVAGYKVAIVTSASQDRAVTFVDERGIGEHADLVVGVNSYRMPKPAPDVVQHALDELHVGPEQALMVGDMSVDVDAAHGAGVRCIGITHGMSSKAELVNAGADFIISELTELLPLITKIQEES